MVERIAASALARAGVFGAAYFAGAELGHALSVEGDDQVFATFWPPAGLFLATLTLNSYRSWWVLLLAAWGANLTSDTLLHDKSAAVSIGFSLANSLEACLGAWLLRRFVGTSFTLARLTDVVGFVCLSALVSTMAGATIGAGTVKAAYGTSSYWSVWQMWWIGDALGVLVIAPVILTWAAGPPASFRVIQPWQVAERVLIFGGMILVAESVYGEWLAPPFRIPIFILPFLLWAGMRFGPRGAAAAILVVATIGVWHTSQGRGPYMILTSLSNEQVLRAQGTLAVISLCVLLLAAIASERRQAEQERTGLIAELQTALAEIKTLRGLIPMCAWCKKIRDDQDYWHSVEDYITDRTEARFTHGVCPECEARLLKSMDHSGVPTGETTGGTPDPV